MHSIYKNKLVKEYFLKYERSEEDYKKVGDDYLIALSNSFSFARYKLSDAVKQFVESVNLMKKADKLKQLNALIGKSKYHK